MCCFSLFVSFHSLGMVNEWKAIKQNENLIKEFPLKIKWKCIPHETQGLQANNNVCFILEIFFSFQTDGFKYFQFALSSITWHQPRNCVHFRKSPFLSSKIIMMCWNLSIDALDHVAFHSKRIKFFISIRIPIWQYQKHCPPNMYAIKKNYLNHYQLKIG